MTKRPENAQKLCLLECRRLGLDFIGIASNGTCDMVAWYRSGDGTYGYHTTVTYDEEKASFYNGHYNLSFVEMCSGILNKISEESKENITQLYRRIKSA